MKYGSLKQAGVHQEVRSRCNNAIGDVETDSIRNTPVSQEEIFGGEISCE